MNCRFPIRGAGLLLVAVTLAGVAGCQKDAGEAPVQDNEVSLQGTILCARCALKEAKTCTTALVVKQGEKEVTYYLKDKGNKESYHEEVCGGGREEGTVVGTVTQRDGKKWLTPTKVQYAKK
jgi:hypothetical protein